MILFSFKMIICLSLYISLIYLLTYYLHEKAGTVLIMS